ncbi:MAG: SpoIIE family protein phosphatase, partial [Vicingaceae bacterium]|nr:SpoIIE family protein phosphatase [Vicingaceae bacterium]
IVKRNKVFYMLDNLEPKNYLLIYDTKNKTIKRKKNIRYNNQLILTLNNNIISYKIGNSNSFTIVDQKDNINNIESNTKSINRIVSDAEENIWIASNEGLIKYSNAQLNFKSIKTPNKEGVDFKIGMSVLDNKQNFWYSIDYVGLDDFGYRIPTKSYLCKYNPNSKITDTLLSNNTGFDLTWNNESNTLWIKSGDIFYHAKNGIVNKTNIQSPYARHCFKSNVLYGTNPYKKGLSSLKKEQFVLLTDKYKIVNKNSTNLFLKKGNWWEDSTGIEVSEFNTKTNKIELIVKLDSGERVRNPIQNANKNYWVFTYKNQKAYYISPNLKTKKNNAYPNSGARNNKINTVADKSGNVWITSNMGLNFLTIDNDTIKSDLISKNRGLSSTIINDLYVDKGNVLWIATNNGVNKLDVNSYVENGTVSITQFGKKEGLKDVNCTKFIIRNEQLIVVTNSGFAIIDDTKKLTTLDAPNPYFLDLDYIIDGDLKRHKLSDRTEMLAIDNPFAQIYIMFNAIKFNNTSPLQYKAVLSSGNEEIEHGRWSDKEEVKFHQLSPGKYKVELYCRVGAKGKPSEPTILEFKILPAWWQTWWFESIVVLLVLALLYLLYKWRTNALVKRQKQLEQIVKEKTAEANKERDLAQGQKEIIEEAHREITDSINYAERIQRSFLATKEMLDENLKDYFVFFQPKEAVSGDFYWAGKLNNGNFAVVNADSTGHGVPGAIMSILNISSIEKAVENKLTDPSEIFNATRKTIIERLKKDGSEEGGKDGMDASIISFDFANSKFSYTAANNPIWVIRKGEVIIIKPEKMPVGKHEFDHVPFTQQEFELQKGDIVYTITDGFQDQFGGEKGKKFMVKRLRELLLSISHLPMQEQQQELNNIFFKWKGNEEQVDDVCVIGVRV